jgi:hypothetical protein
MRQYSSGHEQPADGNIRQRLAQPALTALVVLAGGQHIVEQHDALAQWCVCEQCAVEPDQLVQRLGADAPRTGMV